MKIKGRNISIFKGDNALWAIFLALNITENYTTPERLFAKHLAVIAISYVFIIVISSLKYNLFKKPSALIFGLAMVLSAMAMLIGSRWLRINGHSFQPSEILKLSTIMVLAWHMDAHKDELSNPKMLWRWLLIAGLASAVIFGLNFSTAALLFLACLFMMFFAGADKKWWWRVFGISMLIGVLVLMFFYFFGDQIDFFRSSTWGSRLDNWMHPNDQELTQENMARMAIARGDLTGAGVGATIHARLMTQACNDFIFAIIIEEWGSVMAMVVFFLYCLFFRRCIYVVGKCKDVYGATLVAGISVLIFLQALVNMSVAVGLLPVTGQTLPFVSYGGTAYVVLSCGFGVIQSVAYSNNVREKKEKLKAKENETEGITAGD